MAMDPFKKAKREATRRLNESGETHLVVGNLGRGGDCEVIKLSEWSGWHQSVLSVSMPPQYQISISPGNIKLLWIPSISLPPPMTCGSAGRPCYGTRRGENCYAMPNMYLLRSKLRQAWDRNWRTYRADCRLYFVQISAYLNEYEPRKFRFHVGGGCPDQEYLNWMLALCNAHESTRFMMFDKGYDMGLRYGPKPDNLAIVLSTWPGMDLPGTAYDGFPRAWLNEDPRKPHDAIECSGHCQACGMCWDLQSTGRDVAFPRH